jgi:hypothetical protein
MKNGTRNEAPLFFEDAVRIETKCLEAIKINDFNECVETIIL